jgi:dienelactone hydrolase
VRFAPRSEPEWGENSARASIADTNAAVLNRIKAALDLAWLDRLKRDPAVEVSRLSFGGGVSILHLPGEAFVEYQLFAQSLRPADFVAVAAYGESGSGYICTDAALSGGGYEPTMSRVGPPSEFELKGAITRLLAPVPAGEPPFYADKLSLLWWRDRGGLEHPVRDSSEWSQRRTDIVAAFEQVTGPQPPVAAETRLDMQVHEESEHPRFVVRRISYVSEPGDRVPALLLLPRGFEGRRPAMLCLHQTTAVGKREPAGLAGDPELGYAAELAARGYVTLAPDYPNFGEYVVDPYALGYVSATRKGIWNHRRALDLLQSLAEVDPGRIGAIGHSLGGHNAIFLAVMDPRVQVVVTSCGFNAFPKYYGGDLKGWSHAGYMPRISSVYGCEPGQMPFDFTELLAALAPRPVFVNAPMQDANFEVSGVHDCLEAARPVYRLFEAGDALVTVHPDCGHSFPRGLREQSYAWLDRVMAESNP